MTALGTDLLDKRIARSLGLSSSTLEFIRGTPKTINGRPRLPEDKRKPRPSHHDPKTTSRVRELERLIAERTQE